MQMRARSSATPSTAGPAEDTPGAAPHPSTWRLTHLTLLIVVDAICIYIALNAAAIIRFGDDALQMRNPARTELRRRRRLHRRRLAARALRP